MVIAANFRKYPEAMALQFPLRLGKPRWHTSRPTTRLGRAFRAAVGRAAAAAAALPWAERKALGGIGKKQVPQWFKDAKRRALALAKQVRAAVMVICWASEEGRQQEVMRSPEFWIAGMLGAAGTGVGPSQQNSRA